MSHSIRYLLAGHWLATKARKQAQQQGHYRAALNLRKQGCPIDVALAILCNTTPRP